MRRGHDNPRTIFSVSLVQTNHNVVVVVILGLVFCWGVDFDGRGRRGAQVFLGLSLRRGTTSPRLLLCRRRRRKVVVVVVSATICADGKKLIR